MWSNAGDAFGKTVKIIQGMDRWTAKFSIGHLKLNCNDQEEVDVEVSPKSEKIIIDYWDQFVDRCKIESVKLQTLRWISPDDILSVSATATIAVPAVTIGNIFCYVLD